MPGYHVLAHMFPRYAYLLLGPGGKLLYGPPFMSKVLRRQGIAYECWPVGCYTTMSTRAQDWRLFELFVTDHPWHCVPYSHQHYMSCGALGAQEE